MFFFVLQGDALCKDCFYYCFETEIHEIIVRGKLFKRGMKVAIGASGGKGNCSSLLASTIDSKLFYSV